MSRLKKSYEISVWKDVQEGTNFVEKRIAIIGSDAMSSLSGARSPKFKKNINGSKELTFTMYSQYIDPISGEDTHNPFVDLIDNETKIKLHFRNKWYDLIVKDIQEDSNQNSKQYTATDQFVIELSKNGHGLTLDTSLMNNTGNLKELGEVILKDTGWDVEVPEIPQQYITEQLIELMHKESGATVYAFFSSCKEQPARFQYITELGDINTENIYDKSVQSYTDMAGKSYTTNIEASKYGFTYPMEYNFIGITNYRANRLVYTHKSKLNPTLNRIVYSYNEGAVEGYTNTEYITPNLIQNLVTNSTFKSTSGWVGSYITSDKSKDNKGSVYDANVEVAVYGDNNKLLIDSFSDGTFDENTKYTSYLHATFKEAESVLINSGFYDNRSLIKNLNIGQKFVLLYKTKKNTNGVYQPAQFNAKVGVGTYDVSTNHYIPLTEDQTFITFSNEHILITEADKAGFDGYYYAIGTVIRDAATDEKAYKKLKVQLFITGNKGTEIYFEDLQIFPYILDNSGKLMLPHESATGAIAQTTYYYYNNTDNQINSSATGYRATEQEYKYCYIGTTTNEIYKPDYTSDKVLSISVKQSNYFNAIQSLCETFEVWADLDIAHDEEGHVLSKKVVFKENIENPNYVGFRYGVNLKQSKRTIDSKQIVTKLIVPDNTNEFAPNGFCSIARAGANTSGENYIYDFSYYYNFNKLDSGKMHDFFYRPKEENDTDELQGYYIQLSELNRNLSDYIDRYTNLATSLMQAEADKQIAESGKEAAEEKYKDLADTFLKTTGYAHTAIPSDKKEMIKENSTLSGYLIELSEYFSAWKRYINEEEKANNIYNQYKQQNDLYLNEINRLNEEKEKLITKFYKRFYRFIQEGTWKGDEYTDDDKYYSDAVSTAANSALPKVTYSFSVIDISQLPDYEDFVFDLADKTWVEDPELFGNGRETVVITEITYALDEPDKNSVKVQNHRDQFSSLFQKVTATTQSVQYAAGAWDKAASFASSNPVEQAAFLQSALTDAEMKLQNAGEQSVVWDKTGVTVTDKTSPNQQLRLIGGAILMRDQESKDLKWQTAISAAGINAKIITAGQLNTANILIMNGNEPYFRWDAFGISAYYFNSDNPGGYLYGLDTTKGVRFDRFGIYSYNGKDGANWHPNSIQEIQENSNFALTWEGLELKIGQGLYTKGFNMASGTEVPLGDIWHTTKSKLGKAGKYVYNTWVNGYPSYDPAIGKNSLFVKVLSIGDADGNEQLVIYDDGTLTANRVRLTGGVEWTPEASPARSIYGPIELMNYRAPSGWYYKDIPDNDPGEGVDPTKRWHKIKGANDVLYCHTDTAGAVWDGPFLITGRSIKDTKIWYSVQETQTDPSKITYWSESLSDQILAGSYVYTRYQDKYDDGTESGYRYVVSCPGNEATQCYIESPIGNPISLNENDNTEIQLVARMFRGNEEIDALGQSFNYTWYKRIDQSTNTKIGTSKYLNITIGSLRDAEIYFEAAQKQ